MPHVLKLFDGKAVFAPDRAWLVAVKADSLYHYPAAAAPALLSVKQLCGFQSAKQSGLQKTKQAFNPAHVPCSA
jgi:hypothetical protein